MSRDAILQFQNLLFQLSQDPRIEKFQGLVVNTDGSLLLTHRHGSRYFASLTDLLAWAWLTPLEPPSYEQAS